MVAFSIFGFSVYWYGIFYALAFLLGYIALAWIGKKGFFAGYPKLQKLLTEQLEDLIFTIAVGVVLGGRLGHILIYGEGYYFQHWEAILKIWEGGMSFIGGIFGVLISIFVFFRLQGLSKRDYLMTFDLMLIFVPLGIFLGRFGNFLNQELYGIPVEQLPSWISSFLTGFGLTHMYPKVDQLLRVNTNLLSMLLEGMLLLVLQVRVFWRQIKKRQRKVWLLATNFLLYYSIIRFGLEYLRADSQMEQLAFLSKSQRFFLLFIIVAVVIKMQLKTPLPLSWASQAA